MHKLLLIALFISIIPGQLIRLELADNASLTITDIFAFCPFALLCLRSKDKLKIPKNYIFFMLFSFSALISTIFAFNNFNLKEILISLLFLVRFIIYSSIAVYIYNFINKASAPKFLRIFLNVGVVFTVLGILQVIFVPDLSFLTRYGWDPHQRRLVSTILDPNFAGLLLIFLYIVSLSLYLTTKSKNYIIMTLLFTIGIVLTFSRSTYLTLVVSTIVLGFIKSPRILTFILPLFVLIAALIPQTRLRIAGALNIDDTAKARIESWQRAIDVFSKNPILGVGFNTYRYAQKDLGHFEITTEGGHSGSGADSSFLLTLATTGLVGFSVFCFSILMLFVEMAKDSRNSLVKLVSIVSVIALIVHSQFVNSFFFPQTMAIFWILMGFGFFAEKRLLPKNNF